MSSSTDNLLSEQLWDQNGVFWRRPTNRNKQDRELQKCNKKNKLPNTTGKYLNCKLAELQSCEIILEKI